MSLQTLQSDDICLAARRGHLNATRPQQSEWHGNKSVIPPSEIPTTYLTPLGLQARRLKASTACGNGRDEAKDACEGARRPSRQHSGLLLLSAQDGPETASRGTESDTRTSSTPHVSPLMSIRTEGTQWTRAPLWPSRETAASPCVVNR